jgi:ribonuclease HI
LKRYTEVDYALNPAAAGVSSPADLPAHPYCCRDDRKVNVSAPHYLLISETGRSLDGGRWRFMLRAADGSQQIDVADVEPEVLGERLDLLTIVRALESLDQPSRVTLLDCSPYVRRGMQYGLSEWRRNGWRWECFGQMVPVKNGDLWQRIDRALRFHDVECRSWRLDPPHPSISPPNSAVADVVERPNRAARVRFAMSRWLRYSATRMSAYRRRCAATLARLWRTPLNRPSMVMASCSQKG